MSRNVFMATGLLAAALGLCAIPTPAEASCKNICVVAYRDCMRYAGGDPGLEAACQAELDQCILDCNGPIDYRQASVIARPERLESPLPQARECPLANAPALALN